jgi:Domain of unknown function (DUF4276)
MMICPVVEGHGERTAFPILIRRLAQEEFGYYDLTIAPAHRLPRGRLDKGYDLEKAAELARRRIAQHGRHGAIVLLMDADDDCAAQLAPSLRSRLRAAVGAVPLSVVLATREYEAWFLAAAQSLRTSGRVSPTAMPPPNPEAIRGAKEYLEREILNPGATYSETVDQEAFTAIMSLKEANACRSFRKLYKDIAAILAAGAR